MVREDGLSPPGPRHKCAKKLGSGGKWLGLEFGPKATSLAERGSCKVCGQGRRLEWPASEARASCEEVKPEDVRYQGMQLAFVH